MKIWNKVKKVIMKRIFLRDQPLVVKLFVFSGLLVVIPMILVGIISFRESSKVLENEAKHSSMQIIELVKHHVEDYLRDFEIDTLKILNHSDTVRLIKMNTFDRTEQKEIIRAARNVLINSAYSRSDITNITILLEGVENVSPAEDTSYNDISKLRKEYWYKSIPMTGEAKIISRTIPWKNREEPVMSIVKRIVHPRTLQPYGMLIIDVNYKRLQDVARKVNPGETGFLYILDDQGHYVYHPNFSNMGQPAYAGDFKKMLNMDSGSFISTKDSKDLQTYSLSSILGWRIITSIPYTELARGTDYIGRTIMTTIVFTLIVAYILGIGFAANLVRPIKRLHIYMKRVEKGDFSGKVAVESTDEIGMLSHGFNRMVDRLSSMLDEILSSRLKETQMNLRQRETELKVLQSQMNPHFLYNSLETIRGMALDKDMDEIAVMSSSLARLMRYNLRNTSSTVVIQQEIETCEIYLKIQKFRFEDKLEYELNIPEWAKNQKIAKFSLQPLVENCIIHGLEPNAEKTKVNITVIKDTAASFVVEITDTGVGMTEESLFMIRDNLNRMQDITGGGAHIGIINVHQRNQYIFGDEFGLRVRSEKHQGTTFMLRLPLSDPNLSIGGK